MSVEMFKMDCINYMASVDDNYFDIAVVDPPYGIKRFKSGGSFVNRNGDSPGLWNNNKPTVEYFKELFRVSKVQIIWGANNFSLPESEYFLIWDKAMTGKHDFAECEMAWVGGDLKKPAKIFRLAAQSTGEIKIHPTQKPVKLYEWIFLNYSTPGDRVLDTHMGSGSSAIAANNFNLDFVGCELDEKYFMGAKERFSLETSQKEMF